MGGLYKQQVASARGELVDNPLVSCAGLCEYVCKTGGLDVWARQEKHPNIQ